MEEHKQYDLRSKRNVDNLKDRNTNTAVKKNTENQPKKTAEKNQHYDQETRHKQRQKCPAKC